MAGQIYLPVAGPDAVVRLQEHLGDEWPSINAARKRTEEDLALLRGRLAGLVPTNTSLVVFGSLGRNEVTQGSDVDWTLLLDGPADPQHLDVALQIERRLEEMGRKEPGREGTFGGLAVSHDIIHKIGGGDDTNRNLTQRILLLLESACIGDAVAYQSVINNVVTRYVYEDVAAGAGDTPYKVPRFLQNDIARYWRTVAVDFAYKRRLRAAQGWALRTAKLRMSRKLTYVAGLLSTFSVATDFADDSQQRRDVGGYRVIKHLRDRFRETPLGIIAGTILQYSPSLDDPARRLFRAYDGFLAILDDEDDRKELEKLSPQDSEHSAVYAHVHQLGDEFQKALTTIFFDSDTPIQALTRRYGVF
ncbi:MAG TPA: nucleotidyltransferase domain-containing protein [Longimicrobium sp.]|nr:nucleotidyltransferase domain-containing protein [Longimicrobium sp.]